MNDFLQLLSVINHYRYHAMGNQLEKNVQVVIFPTVTSGWKCSYLNSAVLESYYSFLHVDISLYVSLVYILSHNMFVCIFVILFFIFFALALFFLTVWCYVGCGDSDIRTIRLI